MFEKLAEDIYFSTLMKLASYDFMEKLANPMGITSHTQFTDFVNNHSYSFLSGLKNALLSGKYNKNAGPILNFHRYVYSKNPNLVSMGNKVGLTNVINEFAGKAANGLPLTYGAQVAPKIPRAPKAVRL